MLAAALLPSPVVAAGCPSLASAPRTPPSSAKYANGPNMSLGSKGELLYDYGSAYGNLGKWSDPYFTSSYALALYKEWLQSNCRDARLKESFLHQASLLAERVEKRGGAAVWPYPFENPHYHLPSGWISGITQSRVASVLYRASVLDADQDYAALADQAMLPYTLTLTQGGVASIQDGGTWFEEAPDSYGVAFNVLNGHITALAGIFDMYQMTGNARWKALFEDGLNAVKRDIGKFDGGFSSLYSVSAPYSARPVAARQDYNPLHVSQLLWLYDVTHEDIFRVWASRFQAYEVRKDNFSAERSINEKTHGPERANAYYGDSYWSTGVFPTWFRIKLEHPALLKSLAVDGHSQGGSPQVFSVTLFGSADGGREEPVRTFEFTNNTTRNLDIPVEIDRPVSSVLFNFQKPVSDDVLALDNIALVRMSPDYATVANDCNYLWDYAGDTSFYNVDLATDGDMSTAMKITCPGYLMVPIPQGSKRAKAIADIDDNIVVRVSKDAFEWSSKVDSKFGTDISIEREASFLLIEFESKQGRIWEIHFE